MGTKIIQRRIADEPTKDDDIRFLLEQLSTIEYAQDREGIIALASRHGYSYPVFVGDRKRK